MAGQNPKPDTMPIPSSKLADAPELSDDALDQVTGGISNVMKSQQDTSDTVVQNQK